MDGPSIKSESLDQPIGFIRRTIFGRTFFGRTFFGRTLHQVGIVGSANRIHRSDYPQTDFLRTDFLWTDPPSSRNRRISQSDSSVRLSSDGLSLDGPSIKLESSDQPIGFISRTIFGQTFFRQTLHQVRIVGSANRIHRSEYFGRTIFGRTFFGRTFLSVRNPKIGPSHEWSRTARVTRSTS